PAQAAPLSVHPDWRLEAPVLHLPRPVVGQEPLSAPPAAPVPVDPPARSRARYIPAPAPVETPRIFQRSRQDEDMDFERQ
ncbi:MAG TPA: hypothetical protein VGO93_22570, partial [Candidatus Xenobia bacterium]